MANQWYVDLGDEAKGPFSDQELKQLANSGQLSPSTRIRLSRNGQWALASAVKGLFPSARPPAISNPPTQIFDPLGDDDDGPDSPDAFTALPPIPATQSPARDLPTKQFEKLGVEQKILWNVSFICTVLGGFCVFMGFVTAITGFVVIDQDAKAVHFLTLGLSLLGGGISLMIWGVGIKQHLFCKSRFSEVGHLASMFR